MNTDVAMYSVYITRQQQAEGPSFKLYVLNGTDSNDFLSFYAWVTKIGQKQKDIKKQINACDHFYNSIRQFQVSNTDKWRSELSSPADGSSPYPREREFSGISHPLCHQRYLRQRHLFVPPSDKPYPAAE